MKKSFSKMRILQIFVIALTLLHSTAAGGNEIISILDKATNLTESELTLLRGILQELQKQYDFIVNESSKNPNTTNNVGIAEYQQHMAQLFPQNSSTAYDMKLPTVAELIGQPNTEDFTVEQLHEIVDLENIFEESLDKARNNIETLVQRSQSIEAELLKISIPDIITYIYEALAMIYDLAGRLNRAAYCTYYYSPQLNESLHNVYDGTDCYKYTKSLVLRIETETVETLTTIKKNARELSDVYRKVAAKTSLLGKLLTSVLNMQKIIGNVDESYTAAMHALDLVENELPEAGRNALECGLDFAVTLPHLQEVITNLTSCIVFVEDAIVEYDFLKPEEELDFNWKFM